MAQRFRDGRLQRRVRRRPERAQEERRDTPARQRQAQAGAAHRPPRRGRGQARGLDHRSVQVHREGRLFLRPRQLGHEGRRRHHGHDHDPPEEGGLPSRPRHHPGPHRGRGGRLLQRPGVAHQEPPRPRRCRVRAEPRRLLAQVRARQADRVPARRQREGLRRLPAQHHQQGRPQLAAAPGQRHLRAGAGPAEVGAYQFPFELNNVTRAYFERMAGRWRRGCGELQGPSSRARPIRPRSSA